MVGRGSVVGLGARIRDHIRIGDGVMVGMGSVVTRPVEDEAVVVGVPAKRIRSAVGVHIRIPDGQPADD
jgi:serine acetyltransferase